MPYSHLVVDLDKVPADEKAQIVEIAKKHNEAIKSMGDIRKELDLLSGNNPEEKEETQAALEFGRSIVHVTKDKKVRVMLMTLQVLILERLFAGVLSLLPAFGVDPKVFGPFITKLVQALTTQI